MQHLQVVALGVQLEQEALPNLSSRQRLHQFIERAQFDVDDPGNCEFLGKLLLSLRIRGDAGTEGAACGNTQGNATAATPQRAGVGRPHRVAS